MVTVALAIAHEVPFWRQNGQFQTSNLAPALQLRYTQQ
jgi:hypothetical protein